MKEISEKKSYKKIAAACLLSAAAALAGFGGTWAYYNDTLSLANPLKTSNTSVAMVEDFTPDNNVLPGETVPKVVAFENTGDMDVFLRVKVPPEEAWKDSSGSIMTNDKLLAKRVIKGWTKAWTEKTMVINRGSGESEKVPAQVTAEPGTAPFSEQITNWTDVDSSEVEWSPVIVQNGGYYRYYKKVLKAKPENVEEGDSTYGGSRTKPILNYIKLEPVSNDRHSANYSDKIYLLQFDAQAVPVEGDGPDSTQSGVLAEWGMKVTVEDDALVWSYEGGTDDTGSAGN